MLLPFLLLKLLLDSHLRAELDSSSSRTKAACLSGVEARTRTLISCTLQTQSRGPVIKTKTFWRYFAGRRKNLSMTPHSMPSCDRHCTLPRTPDGGSRWISTLDLICDMEDGSERRAEMSRQLLAQKFHSEMGIGAPRGPLGPPLDRHQCVRPCFVDEDDRFSV